MKMVYLDNIRGTRVWFNADQIRKMNSERCSETGKIETSIEFGHGLSNIIVYGNIPSVIREIEEQIEFPKRADSYGLSGPMYASVEFEQYEV
tara:strand:+ start:4627 stop:4902 length:276 start_codon:yes stop_codon:yes gene_type:complete